MHNNEHDHETPARVSVFDYDPKAVALGLHLEMITEPDGNGEISEEDAQTLKSLEDTLDGDTCKVGKYEYTIFTDAEADEAARECVEQIFYDLFERDIPESMRRYFDMERWIDDVLKYDGRGPQLASYDGEEQEQFFEGEYYYIYKN